MDIQISRPSANDFQAVARLHADSITEGFLSTLGLPFLAQLYRGISIAPLSGVLVAKDQDTVMGFVAYTASLSRCYRHILARRFFPMTVALLPNVLKLGIYRKCIETLLYPLRGSKKVDGQEKTGELHAELLSIVVSEKSRGCGVGKKLIVAIDEEFVRMGIDSYVVVTHATDLRSNGFYEKCGFQLVGSFANHGKPMSKYQKQL